MIRIIIFFLILLVVPEATFAEAAMCHGGRFEPCICWRQVPIEVAYRPKERVCRGNAAVILRGSLIRSFSVVVRDRNNSDRWPDLSCEQNYCSVFKTQKVIYRKKKGVRERVNCLGAPGKHRLFKNVQRITVKVSDIPNKNGIKDLRRYCIRSPKKKLN